MSLSKYEYFRTDLGVLYCGDCLEIMTDLDPVDLVLTDPPYGMDYQSARRTDKARWKDKIHGDDQYPLWVFDIKPKIATFAFCRCDNLKEIPTPKSFIVWDKMCHSMGDLRHEFGRQWEGIAFYPGHGHYFKRRPVDVIRVPKVSPEKLTHPNEKPCGVYYPILDSHDGTVVDPFFGSGTTAVACEQLNRRWIGIEISEKYCEIAAKRIERERQQLKMFPQETEPNKPEQGKLF
jgi:site-specific DNA-methyltransferase (adenine-specific)